MKNKQDYYFSIFWRILLSVYSISFSFSFLKDWELMLNKDMISFLTLGKKILHIVPNILNYIPGDIAIYVLIISMVVSPFIIFRKTKIYSSVILIYLHACILNINFLINNIGYQTFILLLIFSAILPIPNKKTEISHDNYMSPLIFLGIWINFSLYYFYSGYTKLISYGWYSGQVLVDIYTHPLARGGVYSELYFRVPEIIRRSFSYFVIIDQLIVPLAIIFKKYAFKIWLSVLVIQFGLLILLNLTDVQIAMFIFSFVVLDPDWFKLKSNIKYSIYYDGYCALCHGFVKFVIDIDHYDRFVFKPIQDTEYRKDFNTIIVTDGVNLCKKFEAVKIILKNSNGIFYIIYYFLNIIPNITGDYFYDIVSKNRIKIFGKKEKLCPIIPDYLNYKFK